MATKSKKKGFKEVLKALRDFIWPEGTYGAAPRPDSEVIRDKMGEIKRTQKLIASIQKSQEEARNNRHKQLLS